jgi:hypothetical protein
MNDAELNAAYPAAVPVEGEPSPEAKAAEAVKAYLEKNAHGTNRPTKPAKPTAEQITREKIAEQTPTPVAESAAPAPAAAESQTYTLEPPAEIPSEAVTKDNTEILNGFSAAVSSAGVPQAAAELMLDAYVDVQGVLQYGASKFATGDEYTPADAERVMRRIWGGDYDKNLAAVRATSKSLGAKFEDWLDAGMGNSPSTIMALSMFPDTKLTKAQAVAELKKITADKKYLAGEKFTVIRAKLLGRIAYAD